VEVASEVNVDVAKVSVAVSAWRPGLAVSLLVTGLGQLALIPSLGKLLLVNPPEVLLGTSSPGNAGLKLLVVSFQILIVEARRVVSVDLLAYSFGSKRRCVL
jgi:hypothetical protein